MQPPPEEQAGEPEGRDQDNLLPIANVGRIMKNGVPHNAKISKDAKECVQECVSEFISFITMEANEKCLQEKRKTINGDDLIWAMKNLGFDNYVEPLSIYLNRYKDHTETHTVMDRDGRRRKRDLSEGEGGGSDGSLPGVGLQPGMHASMVPVMATPSYGHLPMLPGGVHPQTLALMNLTYVDGGANQGMAGGSQRDAHAGMGVRMPP